MPSFAEDFISGCVEAGIEYATGVPDGYLVPLIKDLDSSSELAYIAAAREDDCLGIASGLAMCGKRTVVVMQNVGFMNSIGCFATLCLNYRTPFLIVVSDRGNLFDRNQYDILKYRYFSGLVQSMNLFTASFREFRHEKSLIKNCYDRALIAAEPTLLVLDMPPG